jgi:putative acetyltransferase
MHVQPGVFSVHPADYPRVAEVWEASVRATHHFVSEADIQFFRPLVRDGLPRMSQLACVRDEADQVAGFVGVAHGKIEMLFLHPEARGQGAGRCLLTYAVSTFGATTLDVNEQNEQAVAFYLHMGFVVVGRSEHDGTGKPYPLLHLRLAKESVGLIPQRGNSK